jgi:M6 family metalloprotease-like protein
MLCASAQALIVWDGNIVPAWPDQAFGASLAKSSAAPQTGFFNHPRDTTYGVVMIVDFSDQPAKFSKDDVVAWLNKAGYSSTYAKGSVHDYFAEISNGKFNFFNDVFGYYRAKNPKSYYESSSGYSKATELIGEMLTYFDPTVDFSRYDNDKNGTIESISFVYAGAGQTWGQGLWPHSGWIGQKKDGVTLGSYNMSDMGAGLGLYVFCHEAGHAIFGWPDLYWFGDYCIMGNRMSDVNPVPVNDFFRADQGWIPVQTIAAADNANLTAASNGTAFRYINPANKNQIYLWSCIMNTGRYASLKGKGLLLYKFDNGIKGNTSGTSRQLYVVEADGNNAMAATQWPSPGSAATDFFYRSNKAEFSSATNPAALWGLRLYNVSDAAASMTFSVGTGTVSVNAPGGWSLLPVASPYSPVQVFNLAGQQTRATSPLPATIPKSNGIYILKSPSKLSTSAIMH